MLRFDRKKKSLILGRRILSCAGEDQRRPQAPHTHKSMQWIRM
jgi:hypothetical protein